MTIEKFKLLDGPLHQLGTRLGIVRRQTNPIALGFVIGFGLWIVFALLRWREGLEIVSIGSGYEHARLLIAVPLFFAAETVLAPRLAEFVTMIAQTGVVPASARADLETIVRSGNRLAGSWLPEGFCLALALCVSVFGADLGVADNTSAADHLGVAAQGSASEWWFWYVCLTVFRFLTLRWFWRLCLWTYVLGRIARLPLSLMPTNPDRAGGLGYLEVVQTHFLPLIVALSVVVSSSIAQEIAIGSITLNESVPQIAALIIVDFILFFGPLFLFSPKLWRARIQGQIAYGAIAEIYVRDFHRRWVEGQNHQGDQQFGIDDIQSLGDFKDSISVVSEMRIAPISIRSCALLLGAAAIPFAPLLLFQFPFGDLMQQLLSRVTGL